MDYDPSMYTPFAVTADIAIFTIRDNKLSLLLVERKEDPYKGMLALPGGFVGSNEDSEHAAVRELQEEACITGVLEQLRTYSTPDRDPRMRVVTVAYIALIPDIAPVAGDDAAAVHVMPVDEIDMNSLAFDHEIIVNDALERLRAKLEYTDIATAFLPPEFTLEQLREAYCAVWGAAPDPANFRRKIVKSGIVEPTGHIAPTSGRPASLYRSSMMRGFVDPPITRPVLGDK